MSRDALPTIDRRSMIKGAAAVAIAGVVAGCGDEEIEDPDPEGGIE